MNGYTVIDLHAYMHSMSANDFKIVGLLIVHAVGLFRCLHTCICNVYLYIFDDQNDDYSSGSYNQLLLLSPY